MLKPLNFMAETTQTVEVHEKIEDDTYERLGKDTPFRTLYQTTWGPFAAEVVGALYGIVDTFWISRLVSQEGNAAMALVSLMDTFGRAFGHFVCSAASSQLSRLRGQKKHDAIPQVFADLFRLCFIFGIIAPLILIPLIRPLLNFFNATGNIRQYGFDYLQPLLLGTCITCLNLFFCGCLQSEGRGSAFGIVQISSFCINMLIFDPLFMGPLKLGMKGAALSTITAEFIPMVVLAYMFFKGKFNTTCNSSHLLNKFAPETYDAMKVGFTQFISHICFNIPSFFSRKYIELGATKMGQYSQILAALNPVMRIWSFPGSYAMALSISFLPAASYAYGASKIKRTKEILKVAYFMTFGWCGVAELIIIVFGEYIAKIFDTDPSFVSLTVKMLRITYSFAILMGVEMIAASFLQSIKWNKCALILSILTRFLPVPMFGSLLFFTDPSRNVFRTLKMYPLNDIFSSLLSTIVLIFPWKSLSEMPEKEEEDSSPDMKEL